MKMLKYISEGGYWEFRSLEEWDDPAEPRLCRDCAWYQKPYLISDRLIEDQCHNPNNKKLDLVTGMGEWRDTPSYLREGTWAASGSCGKSGKWWKAR